MSNLLRAIALALLLPACTAGDKEISIPQARWNNDAAAEYIWRTHRHGTDCRWAMSTRKASWMAGEIRSACMYWGLFFDLDYEKLSDHAMATYTWEHWFMSAVTKTSGKRRLPPSRWSYGPTDLTVPTANVVLKCWRPLGRRNGLPCQVKDVLGRYRGRRVTGADLLKDLELNIWAGTYHLANMTMQHGDAAGLRAYNAGGGNMEIGTARFYEMAVTEIETLRHLWRDGIYLPEGKHEKTVFDSDYFVHRLRNGCGRR